MITLRTAKAIQGKICLPPSPDLLYMAALAACAAKRRVNIPGIIGDFGGSDVFEGILRTLRPHADIESTDATLSLSPKSTADGGEEAVLLTLPDALLPYRSIYLFIALGMGKTVLSRPTPRRQLLDFAATAKKMGIALEPVDVGGSTGLRAVSFDNSVAENSCHSGDGCDALLSFLLGKREKLVFPIADSHLSTPLRRLSAALGFAVNARPEAPEGGDAEMEKRMRFMRAKPSDRTAQGRRVIVEADFSASAAGGAGETDAIEIVIPGDETLAAALITAKALVPKGSFEIENAALDPWASQAVAFLKRMGAKINAEERGKTAFGPVGIVTAQKSERVGRKASCVPLSQYLGQLPCMTLAAAFAEGKSVFRDLEPMRLFDPDGLDQLEQCLRPLGIRHGEMPDGIVVEGAKEFDGFDIKEPLPAHIAAAFCVAGAKCRGETSVTDDFLIARWPGFEKMLMGIFEFRGK
jgi:hypothetical protein